MSRLVSLDTDIDGALMARARRRALIEGRGPRVSDLLMNPYRFGGSNNDPYWTSVGFLLHFDGTNGATSTVDSGPRGKTVTRSASGGAISTAQSVFGGSSWNFAAGSTYLEIAQDTTYITASGSTPWTWECRSYAANFSSARVLFDNNNTSSNTTGWQIYVGTDAKLYLYSGPQATSYGGYGTAMSASTWYGLRITWDGTTLYFFRDGSLQGSTTGFTNVWGNKVYMGNSTFANQGWASYMDELRWTKGVARSTASYTLDGAAFPNY